VVVEAPAVVVRDEDRGGVPGVRVLLSGAHDGRDPVVPLEHGEQIVLRVHFLGDDDGEVGQVASLGVGELSTPKRASSYEEDGSAFLRSRRGLEDIARRRGLVRWTKIVTGTDGIDASIDAVLCLGDFIQESWTVTQWEAIRWALLGATREDIAKRLHIAHQNVTKRLLAAGWPYFADSADYVRRALVAASDTHQRVQRKAAP